MTRWCRRHGLAAVGAGLLLACGSSSGLINPNYTVADLVRDSGAVLVLRVSAPAGGQLKAAVVETLTGDAPAAEGLVFDFNEADDLPEDRVSAAFAGAAAATAVMCIRKGREDGARVGALEIGTTWLGLREDADAGLWRMDADPNDLETVWGGSAGNLVPAVRYALADGGADFPVASLVSWGPELSLGTLPGPVHGCVVTPDGVVVLCEAGDRLYRPGAGEQPPREAGAEAGLDSRSRLMAVGDFNGDGLADLASWDGTRLRWLFRGADGRFGAGGSHAAPADFRSLRAIDGGVAAGCRDGVVLMRPDGSVRRLPGGDGPCAAADFDNDGRPDLVQVSAGELRFHAGLAQPGEFAAPTVSALHTVRGPRALVCGDFDGDGRLDIIVAGDGGSALVCRQGDGWANIVAATGELGAASGIGEGETVAVDACAADLNGDGRQGVALFSAASGPCLFFNRGFACFGVARSLAPDKSEGPAAAALGAGQAAGVLYDMNGDLAEDLVAVDSRRNAWIMFCEPQSPRRYQVVVRAPAGARDPVTVSASFGGRSLGARPVRAGVPSVIALPKAGKVSLRWQQADGAPQTRDAMVLKRTEVAL